MAGRWRLGAVGLALLVLAGCGDQGLDRGDLLLDEGRPEEAIQAWRRALARRPRDTRLLVRIATAQTRLDRLEEAEATLTRAHRLAPQCPKVLHNLGLVQMKQKRLDAALETFHQVLELQDTYPGTHYYIGLIHEMRGDESTARRHYVCDVNAGPSQAWDRLLALKRQDRERGLGPTPPAAAEVLQVCVVLLALAAGFYAVRLYLDQRET